ncbi:toxin-antitoxin system, toxin component [Streptomyces zhihengii]|uniref:toxin-antitoxin system, toxin component n=1 Tax=Streptomyces zhihengii TaxID=1818004 RepID=UPI00339F6FA5
MITRDMKALRDELADGIARPIPEDARELMQAMCDYLSEKRRREVHLRFAPFPPGTASGLWVDSVDLGDMIIVEERVPPEHQMVIFGHEVWHMVAGHCSSSSLAGGTAAARYLESQEGLADIVRHVAAARSGDIDHQETEAESFGYLLGAAWRERLTRRESNLDMSVAAHRLQMSLGLVDKI